MAATTSRAADRRRAPSPRRPIGRVPILGLSLALLVLSLGTLADPASAATAGVSDGQLTYTADAGEQNDVTILPDGLDLTIRDTGPGVTITAEPGCSTTSADTVTCSSLPGFGLVFVDAGDMDDRVVLSEFPTTVFVPAVLFGGDGGDTLLSGNGDDLLVGCRGDDTLHGFYGDDVLANEFICAGGGDDTFYGGFGADSFSGIGGTETASYSEPKGESGYGQGPRQASVTVTLDNVADDGELGEGDNAMADVEGVVGGEGDDTLTGNSAANSLDGAEGDDTLDGGLGADVLDGGLMAMPEDPDEDPPARNDTVSYASHSSDVAVDVSPQAVGSASPVNGENCVLGEDPIDQPAECEGDTVARFRHATGGSGDDDLLGDDESNTLRGGGGGDTLDGRGSNDTLEGGAGSDDLYGGEDNDTIRARDGESDSVFCDGGTQDWAEADAAGTDTEIVDCEEVERPRPPGAGIARLQGSTLSFEAGDGEVNDVTVSSSGSDFVITDTGASLVTSSSVCSEGAPGSVTCADPGAAVDTISLTLGDEGDSASIDPTVSASIAAVIDGGEGEDQLSGGDGSDTLDGGPEANVADTLNGGGGSDTVTYADRSAPVNVSLDGVVNDGENCPGPDCEGDDIATNIENVTGSEGDDTLSGDTAANSFSGGPGTDTVSYEDRSQPVTVTLDDTSDDGANAARRVTTSDRTSRT